MKFSLILPKKIKKQSVSHLLEYTWSMPRKQRHLLRMKKHLFINGLLASWEETVGPNDKVTLVFDQEDFDFLTVEPGDPNLADILYEDEHLIIVNKPEGMKTHGNSPQELALQNHVTAYLNAPAFVVHRLDKETSGAVLFAKNQFILPIIGKIFEENKIHRSYYAVVQGYFSEKNLTLHKNIGRDRHNRKKYVVSKRGKKAITHIETLDKSKKYSLVRCTLDTGRTHQIRVHLSSEGHPIIGDPLYHPYSTKSRMMLHAGKISFVHPLSGEDIEIAAPSDTFIYKKSPLFKSGL
ncbi:RluA family pseudouridine synthase [Lactococcus muris]|uniref:Pseudouridine synthase n=1 Tax=Lactococcus muris TaxID=2941330 RepID=A0ABV4D9C2_9LACT